MCVTKNKQLNAPLIDCLSCERYGTERFISSTTTELVVECSEESNCQDLSVRWRLYNVTDNEKPEEVILDDKKTPTGTRRRNLVVYPNVLDSSTVYRFELTVTESNRDEDDFGFASFTLPPNSPPKNGSCSISPQRGITLSTQFTFSCSRWIDDDLPLEYQFSTGRHMDASRRDRVIIYRGFQNRYVADSLPAGSANNNYTIYVFAKVSDRFGGETEVEIQPLVVEPLPDTSNTTAFEEIALNALTRVETEFGNDPQRVTETCGNQPIKQNVNVVDNLIRVCSCPIGSIMQSVNAVDGETKDDTTRRARLRQTCIEKMNEQPVESAGDAERILSVLVETTVS